MKNTTAIIMAAGVGGRFLPAAKAVNKCMLPLGDKPIIQYLVEECVDVGIEDIIIMVPKGDEVMRRHFSIDPLLKQALEMTGKGEFYESHVVPVEELGKRVRVLDCRLDEKRGTAIPVQQALPYVRESTQHVLIMNGDAIIAHTPGIIGEAKAAISTRENPEDGILFGFGVTLDERGRYGVLIQDEENPRYVKEIIEKPSNDIAPTSLTANLGWYLIPRENLEHHLEKVQPNDISGEYYLTDAVNGLLKDKKCLVYQIDGEYLDCGNPQLWLDANNYISKL